MLEIAEKLHDEPDFQEVTLERLLGSLMNPAAADLAEEIQKKLAAGEDFSELLLDQDNPLVEKAKVVAEIEEDQFGVYVQPVVEAIFNEAEASRADGKRVKVEITLTQDKIIVAGNGKGMHFTRHMPQLTLPQSGDEGKIYGQFGQGSQTFRKFSEEVLVITNPENPEHQGFELRYRKKPDGTKVGLRLRNNDSSQESGTQIIFNKPFSKSGGQLQNEDLEYIENYIKNKVKNIYFAEIVIKRPDQEREEMVNKEALDRERLSTGQGSVELVLGKQGTQSGLDVTGASFWSSPFTYEHPLTINLPKETMRAETRTATHIVLREKDKDDVVLLIDELVKKTTNPKQLQEYLAQLSLALGSLKEQNLESIFLKIATYINQIESTESYLPHQDGVSKLDLENVVIIDSRAHAHLIKGRKHKIPKFAVNESDDKLYIHPFNGSEQEQWFVVVGDQVVFNKNKYDIWVKHDEDPRFREVFLNAAKQLAMLHVLAYPHKNNIFPPLIFTTFTELEDEEQAESLPQKIDETEPASQENKAPAESKNLPETITPLPEVDLRQAELSERALYWSNYLEELVKKENSVLVTQETIKTVLTVRDYTQRLPTTKEVLERIDKTGKDTFAPQLLIDLSMEANKRLWGDGYELLSTVDSISQLSYEELVQQVESPLGIFTDFLRFLEETTSESLAEARATHKGLTPLDTDSGLIDSQIDLVHAAALTMSAYLRQKEHESAHELYIRGGSQKRLVVTLAFLFSDEVKKVVPNVVEPKEWNFVHSSLISNMWTLFNEQHPDQVVQIRKKLLINTAVAALQRQVVFSLALQHLPFARTLTGEILEKKEKQVRENGVLASTPEQLVANQMSEVIGREAPYSYPDKSSYEIIDARFLAFLELYGTTIDEIIKMVVPLLKETLTIDSVDARLGDFVRIMQNFGQRGVTPDQILHALKVAVHVQKQIPLEVSALFNLSVATEKLVEYLSQLETEEQISKCDLLMKAYFTIDTDGVKSLDAGQPYEVAVGLAAKLTKTQIERIISVIDKNQDADSFWPSMAQFLRNAPDEVLGKFFESEKSIRLLQCVFGIQAKLLSEIRVNENWNAQYMAVTHMFTQLDKVVRSGAADFSITEINTEEKMITLTTPAGPAVITFEKLGIEFWKINKTLFNALEGWKQAEWTPPEGEAVEAGSVELFAVYLEILAERKNPRDISFSEMKERLARLQLTPEKRQDLERRLISTVKYQDSDYSRFYSEWLANAHNAWLEKHGWRKPPESDDELADDDFQEELETTVRILKDGSIETTLTDYVGMLSEDVIWSFGRAPGMGEKASNKDNNARYHAGWFTSLFGAKEVRVEARDENGLITRRKVVPVYETIDGEEKIIDIKESIWTVPTLVYGNPYTEMTRVENVKDTTELIQRYYALTRRIKRAHLFQKDFSTRFANLSDEITSISLQDLSFSGPDENGFSADTIQSYEHKEHVLVQRGEPVGESLPDLFHEVFPKEVLDAVKMDNNSVILRIPTDIVVTKSRDQITDSEIFLGERKADLQKLVIKFIQDALVKGKISPYSNLFAYDTARNYHQYYSLTQKESQELQELFASGVALDTSNPKEYLQKILKFSLNYKNISLEQGSEPQFSLLDALSLNEGGKFLLDLEAGQTKYNEMFEVLPYLVYMDPQKPYLQDEAQKKHAWMNSNETKRRMYVQQAMLAVFYRDRSKAPTGFAKVLVERFKRENKAELDRFNDTIKQAFTGMKELERQKILDSDKRSTTPKTITENIRPTEFNGAYFAIRDLFLEAMHEVFPELPFTEANLGFFLEKGVAKAHSNGPDININIKTDEGQYSLVSEMHLILSEGGSFDRLVELLVIVMHEAAHGQEADWKERKLLDKDKAITHDKEFREKEEKNARTLLTNWLSREEGEKIKLLEVIDRLREKYKVHPELITAGEHFYRELRKET